MLNANEPKNSRLQLEDNLLRPILCRLLPEELVILLSRPQQKMGSQLDRRIPSGHDQRSFAP